MAGLSEISNNLSLFFQPLARLPGRNSRFRTKPIFLELSIVTLNIQLRKLTMAQPTNQDQLMLELINRARLDPQAEADRLLSGNLNEGPPSSTIPTTAVQPLAWNEMLGDAAVGHTQDMFARDFFAHTSPSPNSTTESQRIATAGYTGSTTGENLAAIGSSNSLDLTNSTINNYNNLFQDFIVPGRGHRINILKENFREIGISTALGTNYQGTFSSQQNHAALTTQNFGANTSTNPFLTGVVYTDAINDDNFYTVGEGLGSITVQAVGSSDTFTVTTYGSGGYNLQLAPGTYTVNFLGDFDNDGTSDSFSTGQVTIASQNEKVDFATDTYCFLPGTNILTDAGEKPIEKLQIGENVRTAEGKLETIKWIGRQTVNPNQVRNPLRSHPVLIKAGALGNNIPQRDLYVSPDHAMFVDGLLINAGALVNGISILKTEPQETFVYYHIELENHCLLIAEGASSESFLPQNEKREEYDNGAEYEELYPHGSNLMLWPMDYPRVSSKYKVPRYVRNKLMAIATELSEKVILSA